MTLLKKINNLRFLVYCQYNVRYVGFFFLIWFSLCSIGSLGKDGVTDTVEEVHVKDCTLKGTTNGLRIN